MGHQENQVEAIDAGDLRGDAGLTNPDPTSPIRPRLGAPDDSWSTVFKDVVREAPKTALVIAGTFLLTALGLIANMIAAGDGTAALQTGPPIQDAVLVMLQVAWCAIMNGG